MDKEIIDFEKKGNMVKFYLGKNGDQWGDDWDDAPYEHNAGEVYDEYNQGNIVVTFGYDDIVLEPSDCRSGNSAYSKEDMINRRVPCIIVLRSKHITAYHGYDLFDDMIKNKKIERYYFGDYIAKFSGAEYNWKVIKNSSVQIVKKKATRGL